ncbi:hypothetical protein BDM02DRAFT_3187719 [Thelephora ganbajun]|uniref:Uncharacterized protein n=1 Tax=Thelephora ganbajun TaxID=370292 RepID=A0ACB6ZDC4_THEGA|nr:hypothetical protein BDM02DRAFT_3187719 [Thelephora ganbajun]
MGKTPASTRAGRKPKSKHPERKWCTCQERCDGGKEVATSTYRSHNPVMRDGFKGDPVSVVGGKRKARSDGDGLDVEDGFRETRSMRARRVAQSSVTVTEDWTGTLEVDDVDLSPREIKMHEDRVVQTRVYAEGDGEGKEEEGSEWISAVDVYNPDENGTEIDEDYEEEGQLRATLRAELGLGTDTCLSAVPSAQALIT